MKQSVKSNKNQELVATLFLAILIIFAITCMGAAVQNVVGGFVSSLLCVVTTLLAVGAVATICKSDKKIRRNLPQSMQLG